jgi:single-stranded-DNA-specific exonuclease
MEPYGPGNMKPIFLTRNVSVCDASLLKGEHIKALFTEGKQNRKIPAIGFRMQDLYPIVKSGKLVDILYTIETNTWKNKTTLQLVIKDIKYAY